MSGIDGNVSGLNRNVFTALQKVKDPNRMTESESKELRSAIMKDDKVDAAEADLLQELTQDGAGQVKISAQKTSDFQPSDLNFSKANGAAKATLETLTKPTDLNQLWNGGVEGKRKLLDVYSISPTTRNQVTQFVATKLKEAWNESSITNGYKPVRDLIGEAYATVDNADPKTFNNGRNLLYNSMKLVDRSANDSIPDFLYQWLKTATQTAAQTTTQQPQTKIA
jgi:hypothetical protein